MSDDSTSSGRKQNLQEVIDRLIAEQIQTGNLLKEVRRAINSDKEFEGMTIVGGIKAIIRRFREEQEKVRILNKELDNLVKENLKKKYNK